MNISICFLKIKMLHVFLKDANKFIIMSKLVILQYIFLERFLVNMNLNKHVVEDKRVRTVDAVNLL